MNLKHLQNNLPWTVPYSWEFKHSQIDNPMRQTTHDVLHITKSLGRIADVCEEADHTSMAKTEKLGKELASIAMSVMHIATNHGVDLQTEIEALVFVKNGVNIPEESH